MVFTYRSYFLKTAKLVKIMLTQVKKCDILTISSTFGRIYLYDRISKGEDIRPLA